jgi:hypothetical protein
MRGGILRVRPREYLPHIAQFILTLKCHGVEMALISKSCSWKSSVSRTKIARQQICIPLGQYLIYRAMLVETLQTTPLYLAVPETIFATVFDKAVMNAVTDSQIRLVVINLDEEEVVKWIE